MLHARRFAVATATVAATLGLSGTALAQVESPHEEGAFVANYGQCIAFAGPQPPGQVLGTPVVVFGPGTLVINDNGTQESLPPHFEAFDGSMSCIVFREPPPDGT